MRLSPGQTLIASYWDDNPFKVNNNGHTMFAIKKISPGGHWINIAGLVCRNAKADYLRTAETYACLAVVIADSFINCWDEKYKSKVIGPKPTLTNILIKAGRLYYKHHHSPNIPVAIAWYQMLLPWY
jgi:hypothetical protein